MLERTRHYKTASKEDLTPRQREVLRLIAEGRTNPEIAEHLGITLDGAKFHVREILAKLEVDSPEEAANRWRENRGLGTRIASSVRALIPGAWLKPVLAGSAVGGLALGSVVVGLALNGDSQTHQITGSLPPCQLSSRTNLGPSSRSASSQMARATTHPSASKGGTLPRWTALRTKLRSGPRSTALCRVRRDPSPPPGYYPLSHSATMRQ